MSDRISRRDFLKATLAGSSALVAPTFINYLGKSSPSSNKEFLEVRDGSFYMGGDEYMIKGANYLSRDNPWRVLKRFDPDKVDKELGLAEELGINTIRTPINYIFSIGRERVFDDSGQYTGSPKDAEIDKDYFKSFDNFLSVADGHEIKVMPILFDQAYWDLYNPELFNVSKEYLEQWLPEFADDERIIGWDVKNEPDIYDFFPAGTDLCLKDFLEEITDFIEDMDKNHPKTFGWGKAKNSKYDQGADFTSFHHYGWPRELDGEIKEAKKNSSKPLVLSEFGLTTLEESESRPNYGGNEQAQEGYYRKTLEESDNLDGTYFWRLFDNPWEITKEGGFPSIYDKNADDFRDYELRFGVYRTDYSKKPAAHVVQQYYKWIL